MTDVKQERLKLGWLIVKAKPGNDVTVPSEWGESLYLISYSPVVRFPSFFGHVRKIILFIYLVFIIMFDQLVIMLGKCEKAHNPSIGIVIYVLFNCFNGRFNALCDNFSHLFIGIKLLKFSWKWISHITYDFLCVSCFSKLSKCLCLFYCRKNF